jgi:hypothetical protein
MRSGGLSTQINSGGQACEAAGVPPPLVRHMRFKQTPLTRDT